MAGEGGIGYRDYPRISQDCQNYFGVPGYSDIGGEVDTGTILGYPGTIRVSLVYQDTLTWGGGGYRDYPGISHDHHSYFGVPGYSDMDRGGYRHYPDTVRVTLVYGIL